MGECITALEQVWPRYHQAARFSQDDDCGLYEAPGWSALRQRLALFERQHGRPAHVLLSKLGQDGHDRGVRLIGSALSDAGFKVTLLPLFQTPRQVVQYLAADHSVDLLGISSLAGAHSELLADLLQLLHQRLPTLPVVAGGIIPDDGVDSLHRQGVVAIFGPGTDMLTIATRLIGVIEAMTRAGTALSQRQS